MTTTSGGALLLEAVVPQLAVVLLSLPSQIGQMEVCESLQNVRIAPFRRGSLDLDKKAPLTSLDAFLKQSVTADG